MITNTIGEMIAPIRSAYAAMRKDLTENEDVRAAEYKQIEKFKGSEYYNEKANAIEYTYEMRKINSRNRIIKACNLPDRMAVVDNSPAVPSADELNLLHTIEYFHGDQLRLKAAELFEQIKSPAAITAFRNILKDKGLTAKEITAATVAANPLDFLEKVNHYILTSTLSLDASNMKAKTDVNWDFARSLTNANISDNAISRILDTVIVYPDEKDIEAEKAEDAAFASAAAARFNAAHGTAPTNPTE